MAARLLLQKTLYGIFAVGKLELEEVNAGGQGGDIDWLLLIEFCIFQYHLASVIK